MCFEVGGDTEINQRLYPEPQNMVHLKYLVQNGGPRVVNLGVFHLEKRFPREEGGQGTNWWVGKGLILFCEVQGLEIEWKL